MNTLQNSVLTFALLGLSISPATGYSQAINGNDSTVAGAFPDLGIVIYSIGHSRYYIAQEIHGKYWSRPFFTEYNAPIDTFILDPQVINGRPSDNIIIDWNLESQRTHKKKDGWFIDYSATKIWNLKTREEIFSAITVLDAAENITATDSTGQVQLIDSRKCSYNYEMEILASGDIILSSLVIKTEGDCADYMPDHAEGIYVFSNNTYSKKE